MSVRYSGHEASPVGELGLVKEAVSTAAVLGSSTRLIGILGGGWSK